MPSSFLTVPQPTAMQQRCIDAMPPGVRDVYESRLAVGHSPGLALVEVWTSAVDAYPALEKILEVRTAVASGRMTESAGRVKLDEILSRPDRASKADGVTEASYDARSASVFGRQKAGV